MSASAFSRGTGFTATHKPVERRRPKELRLSQRIARLLRYGDPRGRYHGDRSRVLEAIVLGAVNRNWPPDRIYRALLDPRSQGGVKLREKLEQEGEREARRYFDVLYQKALEKWRECPPTHKTAKRTRRFIRRLRALIERSAWPGTSGATAYSVLLAHVEIAKAVGSRIYTASVRQVAERAGVHHRTVMRAHRRLCEAGWLRCGQPGEGRKATRWTLHRPEGASRLRRALMKQKKRSQDGAAAGYSTLDADAFRWGALGKSTGRVFQAVERLGPASIRVLSRTTSLKPRQVRYHLRKLVIRKLVRPRGRRFERGDADLAQVAALLRTLGAGAVQHARNEQERRAYRLHRLRLHMLALARERRWPALELEPKVSVVGGERAWRQFVLGIDARRLSGIRRLLLGLPAGKAAHDATDAAGRPGR